MLTLSYRLSPKPLSEFPLALATLPKVANQTDIDTKKGTHTHFRARDQHETLCKKKPCNSFHGKEGRLGPVLCACVCTASAASSKKGATSGDVKRHAALNKRAYRSSVSCVRHGLARCVTFLLLPRCLHASKTHKYSPALVWWGGFGFWVGDTHLLAYAHIHIRAVHWVSTKLTRCIEVTHEAVKGGAAG